jgi:hypothetical protein
MASDVQTKTSIEGEAAVSGYVRRMSAPVLGQCGSGKPYAGSAEIDDLYANHAAERRFETCLLIYKSLGINPARHRGHWSSVCWFAPARRG